MMMDTGPAFTPEAVLFDCDGTLLLTADLHFEAMAEAVRRQDGRMPRDWYMALTGLGREDTFARLAAEFGLYLDLPQLCAESVALTAALARQAAPNPSVAALARSLAGRLPIAVVTNSEAAIARPFLRETGLLDFFDAVVTVEAAARAKPAPDLYIAAARELRVEIRRCLVLEDSAQGIAAAQAAGATCLDVRNAGWKAHAAAMLAHGPGPQGSSARPIAEATDI
jgi:HAD superfamily hydrolase (TIGR01509 family)